MTYNKGIAHEGRPSVSEEEEAGAGVAWPACRWAESRGREQRVCHSPKYVAPPNQVVLDFCRTCTYRDHAGPGAPRPPDAPDPLLPAPLTPGSAGRPWTHLPPIYCITCWQTPERTHQAARHFRELGLQVQFFPGIHGRTFGLRTVLLATPGYNMPAGH